MRLEERRTQAVLNRRWSDPQSTDDLAHWMPTPSPVYAKKPGRRPMAWMKCMRR